MNVLSHRRSTRILLVVLERATRPYTIRRACWLRGTRWMYNSHYGAARVTYIGLIVCWMGAVKEKVDLGTPGGLQGDIGECRK
jgi:hypothetical protein